MLKVSVLHALSIRKADESFLAASKEELLEMIAHGAEHIVNSGDESVLPLLRVWHTC